MANINDKDNRKSREHIRVKIMLESHINTIYLLGLISEEMKDKLIEILGSEESVSKSSEVIDYIIDLYHTAIDSKVVTDTQKDISLVKTLLEGINHTFYQNDGQVTLNILDRASSLLLTLEVNKALLKNEIISNIAVVRERFKNNTVLDQDNVSVIIGMLNQLKLVESI